MRLLASLLALGLATSTARGEWPEFRGPNRDGSVPPALAEGLPTEWSEDTNVAWKRPVHGLGWSTPLVMEGKVWLTTATEDGREMSVICLDEATGEVLLDRVLITSDNPEPLGNRLNSFASCTGALAPGRAWLHFGAYGTFCLDSETFEVLWQRRDLTLSHWRGAGSSLLKWKDRIVLTMDGADQQYLVALDTKTGETLWRRDRSTRFDDLTDGIPAGSGDRRKAYSTPLPVTVGDTVQLVSNGAKAAWAYDARTGEEIWNVHYSTHSASSRPVHSEKTGLVYINTGLGKPEIWAVELDPAARGDISESHVEWTYLKRTPKRSSPVLSNGLFFMAAGGVASALDAETGEAAWVERAGAEFSASLLAANDLVYFFDQEGLCTVVEAAPEFEVVAENRLDEGFMASPAIGSDGALILRTKTHLYRIAK